MKCKSFIILSLLSMGLVSCHADHADDMALVIIYGNTITGEYDILNFEKEKDASSFSVKVWPAEFSDAESVASDLLIGSVRYGEPMKSHSKPMSREEKFAFERITERNKGLLNEYEKSFQPMIQSGALPKSVASSSFVTAYVRGLPSITADDVLFGQPSGTNLSDYFTFKDSNLVWVYGMDYTMEVKADDKRQFIPASEFFVKDKLFPFILEMKPIETPSEISTENLPGKWRYSGDDIITLSVTIPVRFECYWDWCKALYEYPDAAEDIHDGNIRVKIPLERKNP